MSIQDEEDLKGMVEVSKIAKEIRESLKKSCVPGMTTADLDEICRRELKAFGAVSAPQKEYSAPCYAFYSVNNCVVHGLPNRTVLQPGDLVKIDITPSYRGYVADTACSVVLGTPEASSSARRLVECAERAFTKALDECRVGAPVNRIGRTIETTTTAAGFFVVPELCGHGVGRAVHEDPTVHNVFEPTERSRLTEGLVIAIEPMICNRKSRIRTRSDQWSIVTNEGTLTAHHEHTVLITRTGPVVLTA